VNRRQYLTAGSICALSSVAGCLSLFESDVQLTSVLASNLSNEERTIEVRVLDDGEELQSNELRLDPVELGGGRGRQPSTEKLDCDWDSEPKPYTVEARLDDEWESLDVASEADSDCVFVRIYVEPPGPVLHLRVFPCDDIETGDEEFVCEFTEID